MSAGLIMLRSKMEYATMDIRCLHSEPDFHQRIVIMTSTSAHASADAWFDRSNPIARLW